MSAAETQHFWCPSYKTVKMVYGLQHHWKPLRYRSWHIFEDDICTWIQAVRGALVDGNHEKVICVIVSTDTCSISMNHGCLLFTPAFSSQSLSTRPRDGCSFQTLEVKFHGRNISVFTIRSIDAISMEMGNLGILPLRYTCEDDWLGR